MAPKQQISKKAQKEKKERAIEDLTFGLKNKNKSAKVKEFVNQVKSTVKNSNVNKDAVGFLFFNFFPISSL